MTTLHEKAVEALTSGQPVVFPTDTVYGLGVAVRFAPSPQILYDIKQRTSTKPVAWLVSHVEDLAEYGSDVPAYAFDLANAYWPGALTLIVRTGAHVPPAFSALTGTVGLRMPNNAVTRQLISDVGSPLAATSANLSGFSAPSAASDIDPRLLQRVAAVLVGDDAAASGVASTVVDCTGPVPVIVREGGVTAADVADATGLCPHLAARAKEK